MPKIDFTKRATEQELMDKPVADPRYLINTIRQLALINPLFTGYRKLLKKYVISLMKTDREKTWRYMDLGAGGGDMAIWLLKQCRKNKIKIRLTCIDNNPIIARYAEEQCSAYPEITIQCQSAFDTQVYQEADIVFANHLLHHLSEQEITELITIVSEKAKHLFLFDDIRRSKLIYFGYGLFSRLFLHDSFAAYDGSLSIRKGFSKKEWQSLSRTGQLAMNIHSSQCFPGRLVMVGYKKEADHEIS